MGTLKAEAVMTDTPVAAATIAESITDTNHGIARVGFAPTLSVVATGDGAGTGATGVIAGTCDRHRIIITTGSGPSDGKQATVSYPGGSLFAKEPINRFSDPGQCCGSRKKSIH